MKTESFELNAEVLKVDSDLGLVFGWAIVSKRDGEPYFDLQGDHIPEESMLAAAFDFAKNAQFDRMHDFKAHGRIAFLWPMTTEVAKAFGVETSQTGLMIAVRPDDATLEEFRSGKLRGFSIGGVRGVDEEVADAPAS